MSLEDAFDICRTAHPTARPSPLSGPRNIKITITHASQRVSRSAEEHRLTARWYYAMLPQTLQSDQ